MDQDALVALIAILAIIGIPMIGWIISRVLSHRERIEMIRHGYVPPPTPYDARVVSRAMRRGMPIPGYGYDPAAAAHQQLRRGVSVTFVGLALLIGLSFIGYSSGGGLLGHFMVGPWLLGGLIPLFVGIAQIVGALMSGARFSHPYQSGGFGLVNDLGGPVRREPEESDRPVKPPDMR
ncbi:MAG TPA: hypothetical protein VIN40_01625 [Candidatus Tyrphobacter sp.]